MSGFQIIIPKPGHWTTRHVWTIQIPDLFDIQIHSGDFIP